MPQVHLPIFPTGATTINSHLAFERRDGKITYFFGSHPSFIHDEGDLQNFRMITSQFIVTGNAKTSEIIKCFGLPPATVKRYTRLYREKGPSGFFQTPTRRGPVVLTPEVLEKAQALLDEWQSRSKVAESVGVKVNTLSKAIHAGRLHEIKKKPISRTDSQ